MKWNQPTAVALTIDFSDDVMSKEEWMECNKSKYDTINTFIFNFIIEDEANDKFMMLDSYAYCIIFWYFVWYLH